MFWHQGVTQLAIRYVGLRTEMSRQSTYLEVVNWNWVASIVSMLEYHLNGGQKGQ